MHRYPTTLLICLADWFAGYSRAGLLYCLLMPDCPRVVKLVRALRKGWIKRDKKQESDEPPAYLLWQDDGMVSEKTANGERWWHLGLVSCQSTISA